jgi:hypothetical protein
MKAPFHAPLRECLLVTADGWLTRRLSDLPSKRLPSGRVPSKWLLQKRNLYRRLQQKGRTNSPTPLIANVAFKLRAQMTISNHDHENKSRVQKTPSTIRHSPLPAMQW